MPQLDLINYGATTLILFFIFWILFVGLYVAVSYTMQKKNVSIYFKLFMILSTMLVIYSISNPLVEKNTNVLFVK